MDDADDSITVATRLLTGLRGSQSDAQGTPPVHAQELAELLGTDRSLCESFLSLVMDLASEPSLLLRRSAVSIVTSLIPRQPSVLPTLVDVLLVLTREGNEGEEDAGGGGGGAKGLSLQLTSEVARAAQALLRPLIGRILTQPPSNLLLRAWQNWGELRGRLEQRLQGAGGEALCSSPAFVSILALLASSVLVGTNCILVPPAAPPMPPSNTAAAGAGAATAASPSNSSLPTVSRALWELARDFGLDKIPTGHPIIGREACQREGDKVCRGLVGMLRSTPWDKRGFPEAGVLDAGSSPLPPHSQAAAGALVHIITVLAYCRPIVGESSLAPALLDCFLRPPQCLSSLSSSGAPTLATPALQASAVFSLSTLKALLRGGAASMAALEAALSKVEAQAAPILGTVAPLALLKVQQQQTAQPQQQQQQQQQQQRPTPATAAAAAAAAAPAQPVGVVYRPGNMLAGGLDPRSCLDMDIVFSLPLMDSVDLVMMNMKTSLPPLTALVGGPSGVGQTPPPESLSGFKALVAEVQATTTAIPIALAPGQKAASTLTTLPSLVQWQPSGSPLLESTPETLGFIATRALERICSVYGRSVWEKPGGGGGGEGGSGSGSAGTMTSSSSAASGSASASHATPHFGLWGESLGNLLGQEWSEALDRTLVLISSLPSSQPPLSISNGGDGGKEEEEEGGGGGMGEDSLVATSSSSSSSSTLSTTSPIHALIQAISATPLNFAALGGGGGVGGRSNITSFSAPFIQRLLRLLLLASAREHFSPPTSSTQHSLLPPLPLPSFACLLHVGALVERAAATAAAPTRRRGGGFIPPNPDTTATLAKAAVACLEAITHYFLHCPGLNLSQAISLLCVECGGGGGGLDATPGARPPQPSRLIALAAGDCLASAVTLRPQARQVAMEALIALACNDLAVGEGARGKAVGELIKIWKGGEGGEVSSSGSSSSSSNPGYSTLKLFLKGGREVLLAGCAATKVEKEEEEEEGGGPSKRLKVSPAEAAATESGGSGGAPILPPLVPMGNVKGGGDAGSAALSSEAVNNDAQQALPPFKYLLPHGCASQVPVCVKVSRSFSGWKGEYGYIEEEEGEEGGMKEDATPPPPPPFASVPTLRLFLKLTAALASVDIPLLHTLFQLYTDVLDTGSDLGGSLAALITQELVGCVPGLIAAAQAHHAHPHAAVLTALFPPTAPISRGLLPLAKALTESLCDAAYAAIKAGSGGETAAAAGAASGAPGAGAPGDTPWTHPLAVALCAACEAACAQVEGAYAGERGAGSGSGSGSGSGFSSSPPELLLPAALLLPPPTLLTLIHNTLALGSPGGARFLVRKILKAPPPPPLPTVGGDASTAPPPFTPPLSPEAVFQALITSGDAVAARQHLPPGVRVEILREVGSVAFEEKALFPDRSIRAGLVGLVEGALAKAGSAPPSSSSSSSSSSTSSPLPYLLMLALTLGAKIPDLRASVAELLGRMVRTLGGGAFEALEVLEAGGGETAAPVWEGFVRLTKTIVDLALPLLIELPKKHLVCLMKREGDLKKRFAAWAAKPASGDKGKQALAVLKEC